MRVEIRLGVHRLRVRVVGQAQPKLPVDLGLVGRVGSRKGGDNIAERSYEFADLLGGHALRTVGVAGGCAEDSLGSGAFGLGLGDPTGDHGRVGAGVEGLAVPVTFRVALGDHMLGVCCGWVEVAQVVLGGGRHRGDGELAAVRAQRGGQPGIEGVDKDVLPHDHVAGLDPDKIRP